MQYTLKELIRPEHILVNVQAVDSKDVIEKLTEALANSGNVDLAYGADVIEREKTFPTGLPTEPIPVAIPHADPAHVHKSGIAIATLAQPAAFGLMGTDGTEKVGAEIVILLAIGEQEKQVEMLQQLIQLIQSADLLTGMTQAVNADEILSMIIG